MEKSVANEAEMDVQQDQEENLELSVQIDIKQAPQQIEKVDSKNSAKMNK